MRARAEPRYEVLRFGCETRFQSSLIFSPISFICSSASAFPRASSIGWWEPAAQKKSTSSVLYHSAVRRITYPAAGLVRGKATSLEYDTWERYWNLSNSHVGEMVELLKRILCQGNSVGTLWSNLGFGPVFCVLQTVAGRFHRSDFQAESCFVWRSCIDLHGQFCAMTTKRFLKPTARIS